MSPIPPRLATRHSQPVTRRPLLAAGIWLVGAALVLVAAGLLQVGEQRQVLLPVQSIVLPETCTMHARFGIDCPGCGLTRSFIYLAHGRFADAYALNPASLLVFLYVVWQLPLAVLYAAAPLHRATLLCLRWNQIGLIGLLGLLILQWLWRLVSGELV